MAKANGKKQHWASTPEGRRRMSEIMKARHGGKKAKVISLPLALIPERPAAAPRRPARERDDAVERARLALALEVVRLLQRMV